jgi:DNA polymerase III epsilon subunit-like protein
MRPNALNLKGDRTSSVAWARSLLDSGGFCVLDSETTGLKTPVQFVEIAIVDADGRTLFKGTVRPHCRIEPGATRAHGHTAKSSLVRLPSSRSTPIYRRLYGREE